MAKLTMAEAKRMMTDNNGNLNLCGRKDITELPEGLTVKGWLDLSDTEVTELPENLTVDVGLYLNNTPIRKLPVNLTVDGWLDLSGCKNLRELPAGLTVGGCLDLRGTPIRKLPANLTVGGWLDLRGTPIRKLPANLTVSGCLDLSGCKNLRELPVGLTVGWCFFLRGTSVTKFPIDLTVAKTIYGMENIVNNKNYKQLQNGDYVPGKYIYADNILTLIKGVHKIGGYTVYVGKIKGRNVVSDGTYYAHCSNVRDGIADIAFKKLKNRGTAQYKNLTLDSVIPFKEAVIMYRIVTGACRQGTKDFLNSQKELKKEYTVAEIIEATKGQYGHETFVRFFKNR